MKRKLFYLTLIALLAPALSYGQVRIGIRGGINSSKLKSSDEITAGDYKITVPNYAMLGYHVGLVGQVQLFNFFVQPELLYTVSRNDIKIFNLNQAAPDNATSITQQLNRIDMPVLVGFKMGVFKLEAGPVATFLISDDSDLKKITTYDMQLNRATVGFQAGIGLDVGKIALDIKYEGSLSKLGDGINIGDGNKMAFDSRINQLIVSVGLFF